MTCSKCGGHGELVCPQYYEALDECGVGANCDYACVFECDRCLGSGLEPSVSSRLETQPASCRREG